MTNVRQIAGPPGAVIEFSGKKGGSAVTAKMWGENLRIFLIDNAFRRDGAEVRVSPYVSGIGYRGPFLDIAGNTFEPAIIWLAQQKITLGCNPPLNSNFCPDNEVTRGQMAVFISRALNLAGPGRRSFHGRRREVLRGRGQPALRVRHHVRLSGRSILRGPADTEGADGRISGEGVWPASTPRGTICRRLTVGVPGERSTRSPRSA